MSMYTKEEYEEIINREWKRTTIYVPDKEDVESEIGRKISDKYYEELIDDLFIKITYDDYKEPFLEFVKDSDEELSGR